MRKFIVLLFLPLLISCNSGPQTGAVLSGRVENLETGFFKLGGPGGSRDSIFTDNDGNFSFELAEPIEPYLYYFLIGEEIFRFYVAPGMKLDVSFDRNNFTESMVFTGKGSDINNYIADKVRVFGDIIDYEEYKKEAKEFRMWADAQMNDQLAMLNETQKKNKKNPYWLREEGDIIYTYANNCSSYASMHKYYAELEEFELPESFNDYKNKLDVNQGKYIKSTAFNSYVASVIRELVNKKTKEIKADNPDAELPKIYRLEIASEVLTDTLVLNQYLYSTVKGAMSWYDLKDIQDQIDYFKSNCKDVNLIRLFNDEHKAWKKLTKAQPGMDFTGKDQEGNDIKFSDFKGKYVYVDVWATWCGPCIYEIPFLKKLEADYHDRNIVFISYSIDEDKEAWLKFIPENELGGVQILGEDAWESELCKYYKVNGVPTFMFFDTEGKIISVKMTRPSNQKTRDSFDSYVDL